MRRYQLCACSEFLKHRQLLLHHHCRWPCVEPRHPSATPHSTEMSHRRYLLECLSSIVSNWFVVVRALCVGTILLWPTYALRGFFYGSVDVGLRFAQRQPTRFVSPVGDQTPTRFWVRDQISFAQNLDTMSLARRRHHFINELIALAVWALLRLSISNNTRLRSNPPA